MNFTAVLFAFVVAAAPAPPAGDWAGEIQIPGSALAITIHIGDEPTPTATLDIPAQNLKRQPLKDVVVDTKAGRFRAAFAEAGASFDGVVVVDSFKGTFAQGGASFPFSLTRSRKDVVAKQKLEALVAKIEAARATAQVPGLGVGVVVDGKIVWAKGFGQRDVAKKLPVTPQTAFMIGSTTKAFTTATLGSLKDSGRLAFTDTIKKHVPAFDLADDRDTFLTINDLASHSTGVASSDSVWFIQPPKTRADVLKTLPLLTLDQEPRTGFLYNNWMYGVLGIVAEEAGGQRFGDLVKTRLLTPLGMKSTAMDYATMPGLKERSLGYSRVGDAITPVPWHVNPQLQPAGSASVSTIDDMSRWVQFHLGDGTANGKRVLEQATLTQLHSSLRVAPTDFGDVDEPLNEYGYAWGASVWRGHLRVAHSGGIDGFMSLVTLLPNDNIGVVVLQNTTHGVLTASITDGIVEALLDLEPRDRVTKVAQRIAGELKAPSTDEPQPPVLLRAGTKPGHALSDYAGTYATALFGDVVVAVVGDKLTLTIAGEKLGLTHGHYETFIVDSTVDKTKLPFWKQAAFTFTSLLDGDIDGVKASLPGIGAQVFAKKGTPLTKAQLARLTGGWVGSRGYVLDVALVGDTLKLTVPGQPVYTLVHERDHRFALAKMEGFTATFVVDAAGTPTTLLMAQPGASMRLSPKR